MVRAQKVDEKAGVICVVIMFTPRANCLLTVTLRLNMITRQTTPFFSSII